MRDLPIILLGIGGVGRCLVRQIMAQRAFHALHYELTVSVLAVADRDGAVIEPDGLEDDLLAELCAIKEAGGRLADHPLGGPQGDLTGIVDIAGRAGAVVVDCTASTATVPALLYALDQEYKVVLANKKPLTIDQEVYDRLTTAGSTARGQAPVRRLDHARWEATVGAGLPVIATLNRLVASGDEIERIAGAFSGTLGYVMSGLQAGEPFSAVVRAAHSLGYTEPDPRDDLGGVDVARKALILARGMGRRLDLDHITVEGLYPASMAHLSVDEFMAALPELDADFAARIAQAAEQGGVLRYAAVIDADGCRVGPVIVSANSPLGLLQGTDNLVSFSTRWYTPTPLVIQGRGAGGDATAAGVLSDIIELAYTA